jgi:formylglycine-generating enzyme required for sulfatase activity/tRNA A-37 threonylcarbamoyl transferase component Bud32
MAIPSLAQLVQALGEIPLLEPSQLNEVTGSLQNRFPDAEILLVELVKRGWLTTFQMDRLLQGQVQDLILGPYVLLDRLGEGGMGVVYKARHQLLNRIVALKVTRKDTNNPINEQRFLREIQATALLSHTNIVHAYDAAQIDGRRVFAMEYIEGTDLARLIRKSGPSPVAAACDYIRQAALGLQHAFEHGLVHRDIKPSNLLLAANGSIVKITDMGLVRQGHNGEATPLTKTGTVIGTPDYLAPEQATNSRAVDIRADLYSLGCTFYYLLTGQPPFAEGTAFEKLFKHLEHPPTPIQTLRPDVPPEVAAVVHKLLAKKPEDRYQQPAQVAEVLAPFCQAPGTAPTLPGLEAEDVTEIMTLPAKQQSRHRVALWVGAALGGVGVACLIWLIWPNGPARNRNPSVSNSIGMELAWIPAGRFTMGSPPTETGRQRADGPPHEVTISKPFYLAVHETTVGNFRTFVQATRYRTEAEIDGQGALRWNTTKKTWELDPKCTWKTPGWSQDDEEPVVCVSRRDVLTFCYWLRRKEGKRYRLPTEAEWEYACRAGTTTPFSVGLALSPQQANFNGADPDGGLTTASDFLGRTVRVGSYAANPWGLGDMHGNAWEWCADNFSPTYYLESPKRDPHGPEGGGSVGALRGGSWQTGSQGCRTAARLGLAAGSRRNDIGFRVLLEADAR